MDASKTPTKLVKVTRVLGRTGMQSRSIQERTSGGWRRRPRRRHVDARRSAAGLGGHDNDMEANGLEL